MKHHSTTMKPPFNHYWNTIRKRYKHHWKHHLNPFLPQSLGQDLRGGTGGRNGPVHGQPDTHHAEDDAGEDAIVPGHFTNLRFSYRISWENHGISWENHGSFAGRSNQQFGIWRALTLTNIGELTSQKYTVISSSEKINWDFCWDIPTIVTLGIGETTVTKEVKPMEFSMGNIMGSFLGIYMIYVIENKGIYDI